MDNLSNIHVFISAMGSKGDIHPLVAIAIELRKRGSKITFLVNDYFQDLLAKHEFEHVSIGTKESWIHPLVEVAVSKKFDDSPFSV